MSPAERGIPLVMPMAGDAVLIEALEAAKRQVLQRLRAVDSRLESRWSPGTALQPARSRIPAPPGPEATRLSEALKAIDASILSIAIGDLRLDPVSISGELNENAHALPEAEAPQQLPASARKRPGMRVSPRTRRAGSMILHGLAASFAGISVVLTAALVAVQNNALTGLLTL